MNIHQKIDIRSYLHLYIYLRHGWVSHHVHFQLYKMYYKEMIG